METIDLTPEKKKENNHSGKSTLLLLLFVVLLTIGIIEGFAAYSYKVKVEAWEKEVREKEESLLRQEASIKVIEIGKKQAIEKKLEELDRREADLNKVEEGLKVKESELIIQRALLKSFQETVTTTIELLEPKKLAQDLFQKHLERYSTVDFTLPKPCQKEERDLYIAAKANLDALRLIALEMGDNNKYLLFVQSRLMNFNATVVNCQSDKDSDDLNQDSSEDVEGIEEEYEEQYDDEEVSEGEVSDEVVSDDDSTDDEAIEE